jgi:hypothetical protein
MLSEGKNFWQGKEKVVFSIFSSEMLAGIHGFL